MNYIRSTYSYCKNFLGSSAYEQALAEAEVEKPLSNHERIEKLVYPIEVPEWFRDENHIDDIIMTKPIIITDVLDTIYATETLDCWEKQCGYRKHPVYDNALDPKDELEFSWLADKIATFTTYVEEIDRLKVQIVFESCTLTTDNKSKRKTELVKISETCFELEIKLMEFHAYIKELFLVYHLWHNRCLAITEYNSLICMIVPIANSDWLREPLPLDRFELANECDQEVKTNILSGEISTLLATRLVQLSNLVKNYLHSPQSNLTNEQSNFISTESLENIIRTIDDTLASLSSQIIQNNSEEPTHEKFRELKTLLNLVEEDLEGIKEYWPTAEIERLTKEISIEIFEENYRHHPSSNIMLRNMLPFFYEKEQIEEIFGSEPVNRLHL